LSEQLVIKLRFIKLVGFVEGFGLLGYLIGFDLRCASGVGGFG